MRLFTLDIGTKLATIYSCDTDDTGMHSRNVKIDSLIYYSGFNSKMKSLNQTYAAPTKALQCEDLAGDRNHLLSIGCDYA